MVRYCEQKNQCHRKFKLNHFGEEFDSKMCKNTCQNCKNNNSKKRSFVQPKPLEPLKKKLKLAPPRAGISSLAQSIKKSK